MDIFNVCSSGLVVYQWSPSGCYLGAEANDQHRNPKTKLIDPFKQSFADLSRTRFLVLYYLMKRPIFHYSLRKHGSRQRHRRIILIC